VIRKRLSKFERRIITAILLAAATPFAISAIFVPSITESQFALSLHSRVREELEAHALFFRAFFEAKKAEYSAVAEVIARDPVLLAALKKEDRRLCRDRLAQFLSYHEEIKSFRILEASGSIHSEAVRPPDPSTNNDLPRTVLLPLGLGADAPHLEIVFLLSNQYQTQRAAAEEVATLYDASIRTARTRSRSLFIGYIAVTALFAGAALIVGFLLARRVTKRINALALATERVGRGEFGFNVEVGGNDEITELGDRFNRMIEEIANARDRIVYLEKISGWQDFARRLAHEIKNPLTPIQLAIQELRKRAPTGDPAFKRVVDDAFEVVEEEVGSLTRLVGEFSQFARLPTVVASPVELQEFVNETLQAYNRFSDEANVYVELPDEPIIVELDRVLMRRVLVNLIGNSIEAARDLRFRQTQNEEPAGSTELPRIGVFVRQEHAFAILTIEDNGPGIDPTARERVFEPYYTTKASGTGLGLAIVKKIVLEHGATIQAGRSARLGGAAFSLTFPKWQKET
jgi:two-component system, NtrC family, nitrogen regulation sensor histidine kinase NtrY